MGEGAQARLSLTRDKCIPGSRVGETGHQDISCAVHSGPPSYLHSRRCPHRLRNHSPLTMVAPGLPGDCTPASWHVGSHRRARLPRLAPKSMLGAARGRRAGSK